MPLRVGEHRDLAGGDVGRAHDLGATEILDLAQGGLEVVDLDVEGDVRFAVGRLSETAPDPLAAGVDSRVRHSLHVVQLPVEEGRVEVLQRAVILAGDFEPHDWISHLNASLSFSYCRGLLRPR